MESSGMATMSQQVEFENMINRKQLSIVWSTSPLTSIQQQYRPGEIFQIVLQKSAHMMQIGKIGISFRPIINYNSAQVIGAVNLQSGVMTTVQRMCQGITAAKSSDFICLQSATINNNQILSQTNLSLSRPRNIMQNYMNCLKAPKYEDLDYSETATGIDNGNQLGYNSFADQMITHPIQAAANSPYSAYENDPYPRSLYSQQVKYNIDYCPSGTDGLPLNKYYVGGLSTNGGPNYTTALSAAFNFPLLSKQLTPSVICYRQQQEIFGIFRNRFLVACQSAFYLPVNTNNTKATMAAGSQKMIVTQVVATKVDQQPNNMQWVQPVNGPGGLPLVPDTASIGSSIGNSIARYVGVYDQLRSTTNSVFAPVEQFSNTMVYVKETAIEFNADFGIDMLAMSECQVVLTYALNQPSQVLNAYLQSGLFMGFNYGGDGGAIQASATGPNGAQIQTFMNGCILPAEVSYSITDLVLRIPYITYNNPSAYNLVKQLCMQPQSYFSTRFQQDNILSTTHASRIAIGGSQQIVGVLIFFGAANAQQPWGANGTVADSCVSYVQHAPLGIGHLSAVQSFDSYNLLMSDVYVQIDNQRINVNAPPIANPQYSTYLVTQQNLELIFGKTLNIPFHEAMLNRNCVFLNVNPYGDKSLLSTDSVLQINYQFDFRDRIAMSTTFGVTTAGVVNANPEPLGQFAAFQYVITLNSLVNCDTIRTS